MLANFFLWMNMHNTKEFSLAEYTAHVSNQIQDVVSDSNVATQYAWWILEGITQKPLSYWLTQETITLTKDEYKKLQSWLTALIIQHIPLAYLLGTVPFAGLSIMVRPPILIPRPETEEWVLDLITQLKSAKLETFTLLDIATGSGCIALAVAKAFPHAQIIATDISAQAIALAQENVRNNSLYNVTFIQSDMFKDIGNIHADIIVSNPPYLSTQELAQTDKSVQLWEDHNALAAPNDGYFFIEEIANNAAYILTDNPILKQAHIPTIWIEIGHTQGNKAQEIINRAGYTSSAIKKDVSGKDRVVTASHN